MCNQYPNRAIEMQERIHDAYAELTKLRNEVEALRAECAHLQAENSKRCTRYMGLMEELMRLKDMEMEKEHGRVRRDHSTGSSPNFPNKSEQGEAP